VRNNHTHFLNLHISFETPLYRPNNETIGENKSHHLSTQNKRISPKITFMTPIYLLGIAAFLWYLVKKREKDEVGRRKKLDFSIVQDVDKLIL